MVDEPTRPAGEEGTFEPEDEPKFVGPFRLLERIGSGGMGVVHLAERREPVAQRVALKVIRTDRLDRTYRARFAMEQDALARMDHPNIARLLDAGDANGQSWFAMEFVPGQPLTDYCREHRLSVEQRLQLFVQICDGVQHAHIKGILHRDLKPGNILVREVDGRPVAKIIDFGLAQPVDPLQIRATLHEAVQQVVGTFAYMSPEQATRTEGDLDTRTDVYSLGAVLYELLTGELPLDLDDVKKRGLQWFGAFLREHEPRKPSTRLSELGERLPSTAAERATSPARLQSSVRGDLDWVTMKALARDRQRRYLTVRDLGREVERVLAHRPVDAGPPSAWYVARKWVRRHAVGVSVSAVLLGAGATFFAVTNSLALRARAAELRRDLVARGLLVEEHVRRAERDLWPADAAKVAELEAWVGECAALLATDVDLAAYERELTSHAADEDPAVRSQLGLLSRGRAAVVALHELRPHVDRRLERARTLRTRTIDAYAERWRTAREQLATDACFAGFELPDLPGLVPLLVNPVSRLQEFYLLDSGFGSALPERRADGTFALEQDTGLVFVLVPGGTFAFGSSKEGAVSMRRTLGPMLIARYETSQAQWLRLVDERWEDPGQSPPTNPSNRFNLVEMVPGSPAAPAAAVAGGSDPALLHPVQNVSWQQVTEVLARHGLALPTMAQWIWATNAGEGETLHFTWTDSVLGARVNARDDYANAYWDDLDPPPGPASATWDGFVFSCPVHAMQPNDFGLHNTFGNVAEFVRDGYGPGTTQAEGSEQLTVAAATVGLALKLGGSMVTFWAQRGEDMTQQVPVTNVEPTTGFRALFPLAAYQR